MNRLIRHINGNSAKAHFNVDRGGFEDDVLLNIEDSALSESISKYMKGRIDLEEVINDPALSEMESVVKEMISDYHNSKSKNKNNEKFITDIFAGGISDEKLLDEISNIKLEINNTNINDISAEWVKEWHEKRQNNVAPDPKTEELKHFITSSLESGERERANFETGKRNKGLSRSLLLRYASLSAAAVLGIFMLVRTLIPSYDPDKLFSSYYEPLNTVSNITRGVNSDKSGICDKAIESYILGDYQTAAIGFSNAMLQDNSEIRPRFFGGVTQLALGNYDQAINYLSEVATSAGDYGKEARWYLGLAYLKSHDKDKAINCFKWLAQSSGYYGVRSEKILRRLK